MVLLLVGCVSPKPGTDRTDAGSSPDALFEDARSFDGGGTDSSVGEDRVSLDSGERTDAASIDGGFPEDSGAVDAGGFPDAAASDVGGTDGAQDAGAMDAGGVDAGAMDARGMDAEIGDAGVGDADAGFDGGLPLDCNGVPGGSARLDRCGTCDSNPNNDCAQDCAGNWGGSARRDNCGVCDTDPTNDCVEDCAGVWGGPARVDDCGVCDAVPSNDCVFERYVNAVSGLDTNPGTRLRPYRTITKGLTGILGGQRVKVFPGLYNAALGEVFPINLPPKVTLFGNARDRGEGNPPTTIAGQGIVSLNENAAVVAADSTLIVGFRLEVGTSPLTFGIYAKEAGVIVDRCSFRGGYGGVHLLGASPATIVGNVFDTRSYGIYAIGLTADPLIERNEFLASPSLPIDLAGGSPVIRSNSILGNGQVGLQVQNGSPHIEDNSFTRVAGYSYGCIHIMGGAARIRRNTCQNGVAPTKGIYIRDANNAAADLGTGLSPGGNVFVGEGAPSIIYEGSGGIDALGNTFPHDPPSCTTDIIVTKATSSVLWGLGATQRCP